MKPPSRRFGLPPLGAGRAAVPGFPQPEPLRRDLDDFGARDEPVHERDDDTLLYDYAPSPSNDWANEGLKRVAALGRSVVLLRQVKAKRHPEYMVLAPVAITGFDDVARTFRLSLAPATSALADIPSLPPTVFSKAYADAVVRARLHQAHFRRETLSAYRRRCCICELDEGVLKGAAHIVPDRLPEGLATVNNGLCMCPTHHRAFDTSLLVVKPTYEIAIARERLRQGVATTRPSDGAAAVGVRGAGDRVAGRGAAAAAWGAVAAED